MKEVILKYQTAAIVPAPYAYCYTIHTTPSDTGGLLLNFELRYLHREGMPEDEILDEGFSLDDDLVWKGQLPMVWARELKSLLQHSQFTEEDEESELNEYIAIERPQDTGNTSLFPVNRAVWSYFFQEMMQAILEAAGREKAFELDYLQLKNGHETSFQLKASFVSKVFSVQTAKELRVLEWKFLEECMKIIFQAEFISESALTKRPKSDGFYLSPGDGLWYKSGESLQNPSPRSKVLNEIESFFYNLKRTISI